MSRLGNLQLGSHMLDIGTKTRGGQRTPLPYGTIDAATSGGAAVTVTVIVAVAERPVLFVPVSVITCAPGFKIVVTDDPRPRTPSSEDLHTNAEAGNDTS